MFAASNQKKKIMKKKRKFILTGIITAALGMLFINFVFTPNSGISPLAFENVEALAQQEGSASHSQCIEAGTICISIDAKGNIVRYPGLKPAF